MSLCYKKFEVDESYVKKQTDSSKDENINDIQKEDECQNNTKMEDTVIVASNRAAVKTV